MFALVWWCFIVSAGVFFGGLGVLWFGWFLIEVCMPGKVGVTPERFFNVFVALSSRFRWFANGVDMKKQAVQMLQKWWEMVCKLSKMKKNGVQIVKKG